MFKYSVFKKPILLRRILNFNPTKLLITKCPGPDGSKTEILSKNEKLEILEKKFAIFQNTSSNSLLKTYLTQKLFNKLKTRQTIFQSTLLDCIQSGLANPDSNIGVYAPDPDAYTTFRELFDLIIEDYHNGFTSTSMHPAKDFGNMSCFEDVDPECEFVVSCRIRCGRSIEGYPFNPCLKRYHYTEIEQTLKTILKSLQREFKGDYHDLCSMDTQFKTQLIEDHYLFKEGDRFLQAANACRFWPLGRGIFLNKPKTFVVWVNEEDHIRIISMQKGGDVKAVYSRLVKGINALAVRLNFSRHERLGFLTFCPTNLGLENLDSGVGIYAPDPDAYEVFSDLFNPVIEDYHNGFKKTDVHPHLDFGETDHFCNVDPTKKYVVSIRVRCGRSLKDYPFNPCLKEEQYKEIEKKVIIALGKLEGELAGQYYPLCGMDKNTQKNLIDMHFLFKEGDRFLQAANASRFWPTGRGIYYNDKRTFLVWINEEDHIRVISMENGGDLAAVYRRLVNGVNEIEKKLNFVRDERLGFLTFCPTNLGTTIRASVHIKLPKLSKDKAKFEEVASRFNLQIRGTSGEHSESIGGVYDISNKQRIGITEYEAVKTMQDGILEMIKIEKTLLKRALYRKEMSRLTVWQIARKRLYYNPKVARLKRPPWLPYYLYKT